MLHHNSNSKNSDRHPGAAATRRSKVAAALLRNTDVMADVLGFLPRKIIALQLACVNRQFSALCNCWCQPEEQEEVSKAGTDEPGGSGGDNRCFETGRQQQRKWRYAECHDRRPTISSHAGHRNGRCWSCTAIHCVHFVRHLKAGCALLTDSLSSQVLASGAPVGLPKAGQTVSQTDNYLRFTNIIPLFSVMPGCVRFRILTVSSDAPVSVQEYLVRSRHAFDGAVLELEFAQSLYHSSHLNYAKRSDFISGYSIGFDFSHFLGRIADGGDGLPGNQNQCPRVRFRELCINAAGQNPLFGDPDFFFRELPFVRRQSVIRITKFALAGSGTRGIIDWLFAANDDDAESIDDDDLQHQRLSFCVTGEDDGVSTDTENRCFHPSSSRHLQVTIGEVSWPGSYDAVTLIIAIKEKVWLWCSAVYWGGVT